MTIQSKSFLGFDCQRVPSPCFVVDEVMVEHNLKRLQRLQQQSGAKVLLALKAFSMFALAPLITRYLSGCCASGLHEALLAYEKFHGNQTGSDKREVHTYSPAYHQKEIQQLCEISDHLIFNSLSQWQRFKEQVVQAQAKREGGLRCGFRINPMLSTVETAVYDPCAPGSRLGITIDTFKQVLNNPELLREEGISGLHFHTLCESGFIPLAQTLDLIEEQLSDYLFAIEWLNIGGGHHITHSHYDVEGLVKRVKGIQQKYQLQVYIEPGEAIAVRSGVLVSEVLDISYNQMPLAIMDSSATCHMPDTIEMPYRAEILLDNHRQQTYNTAGLKGEKRYDYRLGGQTCLAGDVMGDYSFDQPLEVGQRLMFDDMAHYTMVKTTTFNGIALPAIAIWNSNSDALSLVKQFSYKDFLQRLS